MQSVPLQEPASCQTNDNCISNDYIYIYVINKDAHVYMYFLDVTFTCRHINVIFIGSIFAYLAAYWLSAVYTAQRRNLGNVPSTTPQLQQCTQYNVAPLEMYTIQRRNLGNVYSTPPQLRKCLQNTAACGTFQMYTVHRRNFGNAYRTPPHAAHFKCIQCTTATSKMYTVHRCNVGYPVLIPETRTCSVQASLWKTSR